MFLILNIFRWYFIPSFSLPMLESLPNLVIDYLIRNRDSKNLNLVQEVKYSIQFRNCLFIHNQTYYYQRTMTPIHRVSIL
jgi:hypothetical protein